MKPAFTAVRSIALAVASLCASMSSEAYVPLLDEVEGINGNNGNYVIVPAWENLDPTTRQKAYFIFPKYLVLAGQPDTLGPSQFGVAHKGYSKYPTGTVSWPPRVSVLAGIKAFEEDTRIATIKKALTERDVKAGFMPPVFPAPVFESAEATAIVSGKASNNVKTSIPGGSLGQIYIAQFDAPSDVQDAFVLDLPPSAGRDASLWGFGLIGKIKGYGNRLDCTITIKHKKVYEHFKARASGQAYWGLVKADLSYEMQRMDQNQSIDFGNCRGKKDQIDSIVMPVWTKVTELADQDGQKMFTLMMGKTGGAPGHPESSSAGWGFQLSSGWEGVTYSDETKINFNISEQLYWSLPMAMLFNTTCNNYKTYFVNQTDPSKPCVKVDDLPSIQTAQKQCHFTNLNDLKLLKDTGKITESEWASGKKTQNIMGCAWDGSLEVSPNSSPTAPEAEVKRDKACRAEFLSLIKTWTDKGLVTSHARANVVRAVDQAGCNWKGGGLLNHRIPESEIESHVKRIMQSIR